MPSFAKRLRVAFLGTGVISTTHALALQAIPEVEIVAACDLDSEKLAAFQQRWGLPRVFRDLGEMLTSVSPDVIHILLPPVAHASAAETCLSAGAHVMLEKPFCVSSEECLRVQRCAEQHGRQVGVNHNVTFMPSVLEVIARIRSRQLGGVEHVTVFQSTPNPGLARGPHSHWMFSGPDKLLLELGPHPLSVIYRFLGRVQECATLASGAMTLSNGARFHHTWQSSMVCEGGTAQMVLSMGTTFPITRIQVVCQDGEALIDVWRNTVQFTERSPFLRTGDLRQGFHQSRSLRRQALRNFADYALSAVGIRVPMGFQEISVLNSLRAFYTALLAGQPVPAGAREGAEVIEACEKVIQSGLSTRAEVG